MFEEVLAAIEDLNTRRVQSWMQAVGDVDEETDSAFGGTALHWAIHWGANDIAAALLQKGANPNAKNNFGATPLHWAAKAGSEELVKVLMAYGGDPAVRNNTADTAIDVAEEAGEANVVEILKAPPGPRPPAPPPSSSPAVSPQRSKGRDKKPESPRPQPRSVSPAPPGKTAVVVEPPVAPSQPATIRSISPSSQGGSADKSLGYTASAALSDHISNTTITSLQRSKLRAEMELASNQKLVEDLREQLGEMSKEMFVLQAKAKTFDEMRVKLDATQKEKLRMQFEAKQQIADTEGRRRMQEHNDGLQRDRAAKAHHDEMQEALGVKERAEKDFEKLQAEFNKEKSEWKQAVTKKEAELDLVRGKLGTSQSEKARLEIELKAIEGIKQEVIDLRKDKALLEVDLQGMQDLEKEVDTLREDRLRLDVEVKKLNGRLAELQAAYDKMKAEWDLAADQLERHKEVVKEMEDGRKENAKLQVKISSLQEELKNANNVKGAYERDADQVVATLQESLKAMQQDKETLGMKQAELELTVQELKDEKGQMQKQKEIDDQKLSEMGAAMRDRGELQAQNESLKVSVSNHERKVAEVNQQMVENLKKMAEMETELKELRETQDSYTMLEKECLELRVETRKSELELDHMKGIVDSLSKEKTSLEDQNRDLHDAKESYMRLQVEHELQTARLKSVEAETEEYRTGKLKGQYKGAREMAHDIEMLNSQLATLESDHNKMELENRSLMEQLARNEVQIQDLESERLELFAAKEMLKKLENVNKEKQTLAQDLRHTQDLADESERQKKTLEEILKERERYLGQKEKELDKKNTELANAQLSKESLTRDLQQKQMDLSIQNKDLEARLREAERGRTEDFRALQAEKESAQREAKAAIKAASGEVQQIKQRLLIMQKERSGLEMQVKALQEAASFLGGTGDFAVKPSAADFTSTPLKPLGTMGTDEDFDLDITPARSRGALPPVQKAQKGHMPRPPPQAAKKDFFAATGGSSGSGSGRMMDDYSGIMEDY